MPDPITQTPPTAPTTPTTPQCVTLTNDQQIVRERLILEDFFQYLKNSFIGDSPIASSAVKDALLDVNVDPIANLLGVHGTANRNKLKTMSGLRLALDAKINANSAMSAAFAQLSAQLTIAYNNSDLLAVLQKVSESTTLNDDQKKLVRERLILEDFFHYLKNSLIGETRIANGAVRDALLDINVNPIATLLGVTGTANRNKLKTMSGLRLALDAKINGNEAMKTSYAALSAKLTYTRGNVDLIVALCQMNPCEIFCPSAGPSLAITPSAATQGQQTLEIKITGLVNAPDNPKVEFLMGDNVDASITVVDGSVVRSDDRTSVTFKINIAANAPADDSATANVIENHRNIRISNADFSPYLILLTNAFTVNPKIDVPPPPPPKPQCSDGIDNDNDGKIDLADPDCTGANDNTEAPDAPPPPSTAQRIFDFIYGQLAGQLKGKFQLQGGVSSYLYDRESVPTALRPAAETPNFGFQLNVGGPDNPAVFTLNDNISVLVNGAFGYAGSYYNNAPDTNLVYLSGGADFRFNIPKSFFVDAYTGIDYQFSDYEAPNRYYLSGNQLTLPVGAGLGNTFGTDWASLRGTLEYRYRYLGYDTEVFSFPFTSDNNHAFRIGLETNLDLKKHTGSKWAPQLRLSLSGSPVGTFEVPEHAPGISSSSQVGAWDWELKLNSRWDKYVFAGIEASQLYVQGFDPLTRVRGTIGTEYEVGRLELGVEWRNNPALFYPSEGSLINTSVTWTLPWVCQSISATANLGAAGNHFVWSGMVGIDPLKMGLCLAR